MLLKLTRDRGLRNPGSKLGTLLAASNNRAMAVLLCAMAQCSNMCDCVTRAPRLTSNSAMPTLFCQTASQRAV